MKGKFRLLLFIFDICLLSNFQIYDGECECAEMARFFFGGWRTGSISSYSCRLLVVAWEERCIKWEIIPLERAQQQQQHDVEAIHTIHILLFYFFVLSWEHRYRYRCYYYCRCCCRLMLLLLLVHLSAHHQQCNSLSLGLISWTLYKL